METMFSLLVAASYTLLAVSVKRNGPAAAAMAVVFTSQPHDIAITENQTARFYCVYDGSNASPVWRINQSQYYWFTLPPKHSYDGMSVIVKKVDVGLNRTSYQCILPTARSTVGFLYVYTEAQGIPTPETDFGNKIETDAKDQTTTDCHGCHDTTGMKKALISGIVISVVLAMISILCTVSILLCRRYHSKKGSTMICRSASHINGLDENINQKEMRVERLSSYSL